MRIGDFLVGAGRTYVIAEIGNNHNKHQEVGILKELFQVYQIDIMNQICFQKDLKYLMMYKHLQRQD
jgi:sialic acid synthase SpsE